MLLKDINGENGMEASGNGDDTDARHDKISFS